jgi:hypothetical protein
MAVNLHATHYRFGVNELAESTHGWHAAEDANPAKGVIANDTTFLLRFTVQETGGTAAGNTDQQFQVSKNGGAFQNITTTSSIVKAVTTTVFANGADLTKRLSGTGTFESSGDGGTHDGLSGGAQNDIAASGNSETECALQIVGADVADNDALTFRLTSPDFTITNDVVPTLTVAVAATTTPKAIPATAVGVAALARQATYVRALSATAIGAPALASASVVGQSLPATAVGAAGLNTALIMGITTAATAVGAATMSVAVTIGQVVAATAAGVASLATQFIEGSVVRTRKVATWLGIRLGL